MQGLAPDRVIYCGTLSKSLAPGLRLGWLVLPSPLFAPIAESRMFIDHATSAPVQATFAEFLGNGDLDRHLRRMRRVYRQRHDVLVAALARWLPDATMSGVAAGLHVLVTLPRVQTNPPWLNKPPKTRRSDLSARRLPRREST